MNTYKPNWDDYFYAITRIISTRSSCDRLHAGALLVKDKRIVASGYNGAPPGLDNCDEVGHLLEDGHCVRTIHAEHNALLQASRLQGASTDGTTLYTLYSPCIHCAKYIVACGVKRVVYGKTYRNAGAIEYLKNAGLVVEEHKENKTWQLELRELFKDETETIIAKEGYINLEVSK